MNRALRFALWFALLVWLAAAAGPSGTWKGDFSFNGQSVPLTFNLKTDGASLTGNVEGLPNTPADIHEGKVDGDKITFWLSVEYEGQTYKLLYNGKVTGDQIEFTFGTEDGSFSAEVTAKRSA